MINAPSLGVTGTPRNGNANSLSISIRRAEEPGGFAVTAGLAGQSAEALQDVGDEQVRLCPGRTCRPILLNTIQCCARNTAHRRHAAGDTSRILLT
jgi:hypothetical protein